jgi:hypothetical protein
MDPYNFIPEQLQKRIIPAEDKPLFKGSRCWRMLTARKKIAVKRRSCYAPGFVLPEVSAHRVAWMYLRDEPIWNKGVVADCGDNTCFNPMHHSLGVASCWLHTVSHQPELRFLIPRVAEPLPGGGWKKIETAGAPTPALPTSTS